MLGFWVLVVGCFGLNGCFSFVVLHNIHFWVWVFLCFYGFGISGSIGADWLLQPADLAWLRVFWFVFGSFWCL